MFSQLFFVLLAMTLITFLPDTHLRFWFDNPQQAFSWAIAGYLGLLGLLYLQSKSLFSADHRKNVFKSLWRPFVNIEILLFLSIYHFGLGAQRFFNEGALTAYQTPSTFFSLFLYFLALSWAYFCYSRFESKRSFKNAWKSSYQELLFVLPFCLPFIIISVVLDGFTFFFGGIEEGGALDSDILFWGVGLTFLCLALIFLPACMILCWRCRPLDRWELKERLEKRCRSLGFRHAGLKIWTAMPHAFTAGIIGIVPSLRYVLFTPALLNRFKPEEIEAILVHEIGHHHYKHLLYYPFIMLGMLISGVLLLIGLEKLMAFIPESSPAGMGDFVFIMCSFVLYAIVIGLYFRVVFGFFSRLFERQADLYIFSSPVSPLYLIQAFDHLGVVTGYTHSHPNWHHFSLKERIEFIERAMENPLLVQQHHQRVKKWLIGYFLALFASGYVLYQLIE